MQVEKKIEQEMMSKKKNKPSKQCYQKNGGRRDKRYEGKKEGKMN